MNKPGTNGNKKPGKVVEQTSCPRCPSSDAFTIYQQDSGSKDATCFSCGYYTKDPYNSHYNDADTKSAHGLPKVATGNTYRETPSNLDECLVHPVRELADRKLSYSTCEHFGVRVGVDTRDGVTPVYHLYPFYDLEGNLTGFKQRTVKDKKFLSVGSVKSNQLFGIDKIKSSGSKLFITEGELDAMSVYQALKENSSIEWEPCVVSIPTGAKGAHKAISENFDIINGYEQIILVFDQDEPGRAATQDICKMLAGKVYTTKLSEKDPNEMLKAGKSTDLKWAVLTNARKYQPDGILNAKDCWDRYKSTDNTTCYPYPPTMPTLNQKTYGCRPGTIVTITAGSGSGKTQFLRELKYHYFNTTDEKIADIALEEDVSDTIGGMLSVHLSKRITLPDVKVSEEVEEQAFQDIFGSGRFTMYDYFGGMDDDNLFSKLRYFTSTGHKFIFLDHLSIIVSEYASEGGERERIDTIMTRLAKLVKETGAIIFLVVHLKKSDASRKTFEQGAVPSLDDLRGSATIKQLSWDVLGLSRDQQHSDPMCANTSEIHTLKCRFTGRTGSSGFLYFDDKTGRMMQTEEPNGYRNVKH
jgi:twinkle protein